MKTEDRIELWLDDLASFLDAAADLVARGRSKYDEDPAVSLAFEALSNRVGDLAKRLAAADPKRFSEQIWSDAAKNRDMIVHHYPAISRDRLWNTVSVHFVELSEVVAQARQT